MLKIYRVLGKKGRITIPYEIRQRIGFRYNDVLSESNRMTARYLSGEKKSATTASTLKKILKKT